MSICLMWMSLNYGFEGPDGPKLCKRIVVCCPTSLVFNWNNEIDKWLKGRIKCIAIGNTGSSVQRDIQDFVCPRPSAPVLILSYETFRNYKDYLCVLSLHLTSPLFLISRSSPLLSCASFALPLLYSAMS
jgi:DNA repair and recombination RAD54-like protein